MRLFKRSTHFALLLASASALPLMAVPAIAQDDTARPTGITDVVTVTARRREETLQDVPIAVTAFSGDDLEELGAEDITFIGQSTPNVTLEVSRATNTTLTAFIRGVGQQDPVAGFEQGVGIYLDDVYLNRPQAAVLDIYDVERIEVLRGPQGTLYGRNTIGGAVKYVTRRLSDDPTFNARLSAGTFGQLDAVVSGSVPLADNFRVGGAFARLTRDGFGDNLFSGEDNYERDVSAARFSAELDVTPNFDIRVSADFIDDTSAPRHGHRLLPSLATGLPVLDDVYDTRAGVQNFAPFGNNTVDSAGYSAQATVRMTDNLTFRSITAYRRDNSDSLIDFDSTPAPSFDAWVIYDNEQFSQEFQLNYETDRLSVVGGLYYLDANAFNAFDVFFTAATSFTLGDVDTETWAIFGEATYDLTDTVSLTVGGRYTEDTRDTVVTRELFLGQGSPYFGNATAVSLTPVVNVNGQEVVPTFTGSRTDDAFNPRIILAWEPNPEFNFYASYSQGFKGGLFDPRGNFANATIREGVEPEFVDSFEVGMKNVLLNGALRTNTAVFFAEYTDVQIPGSIITTVAGQTTFQGTLTNAGAAEFLGLEFEAEMAFSDELTGFLSIGLLDAEYTEFILNGVNVADQRAIQNTPETTANARLNYTIPVDWFGQNGFLALNGSASYRGDSQQFEFAIPLLDQEGFWLLDASAGWTSDDGRYGLSIHGRNLGDEEYITSGYNFPGAATDDSVLAFYGNPRTFTATFTVRR